MKVSFPEMPGPASARASSQPATDAKDQPAFDAVLQDAAKPAEKRAAARAERQTLQQPHWQKFAAMLPQHAEDDQAAATALEDAVLGKTLGDGERDEDRTAGPDDHDLQHDASQFDRLPGLMALHDLRRLSDGGAKPPPAAGDETVDGSPLKPEPSAADRQRPSAVVASGPEPAAQNRTVATQAYPAGPAPAATTAPEEAGQPGTAALKAGGSGPGSVDARIQPNRQGPIAEPVTVVREQNFAAPAPHPISPTGAGLVSALAADSGLPQALATASAPAQPALPVAQPTHMLKIELHPAELGTVTANLRLVGGQLSIELTPENQEAHRRLSSDADAIIKSLRGLGFDIDKVSVLQPQIAATASPRSDAAGAATGSMGRDQSSFQPGSSGGNGENTGGQQSGRNRNDDVLSPGRTTSYPRDGAGGDLFI
jgi:chemotaxis protein MotD